MEARSMNILLRAYYCLKYFFLALDEIRLSRVAANWPQASATIRNFHVESETFPVEFQIIYTYSFQNEIYAGNVMRAVLWGVPKLRDRFPQGGTAYVRVDPQHPRRSYLPTEIDQGWLLAAGIAGLVVSGVLLFLFFVRLFHLFGRP
jgi:hypothetical protein